MTIAAKIEETLSKSSWIRKMFEQGAKLKAEHGGENVFDFSIGNPNLEPPAAFQTALEQVAREQGQNVHGYMPNSGYPHVRKAIADNIGDEQGAVLSAEDIVITCGAAGGLNVLLKALLNPGEEVLVTRPFFVEYTFYAENHGGVLKTVEANPDFTLNLGAIERAITPKTKVMIINSPNNPTGQIYPRESLDALGRILRKKGEEFGTVITLISDEPYRKLVFDNILVPPVFPSYGNSVVVTSHAKDLSLPGERIGYIVVNPDCSFRDTLIPALALTNRILGFVNAPALMQRILPLIQGASVDIDAYRKKRDMLCDILKDAGFTFTTPPGAFYIFPKSPIPDDVRFVALLQDELILAVPGTGFGGPGYFRLAFCVDDLTIERSRTAFKRVMARLKEV